MNATIENRKITKPNQSSEKLLTLMEVMSEQNEPTRLQDIAGKASMNPSTALRFLSTLQRKGYAAQDIDTGRYFLTFKVCGLANNVQSRTGIRNIALPYLRNLSRYFGESVNLSVEQDMMAVYIEAVNGPQQMLLTMQRIGNIAPMHCTASGKLFLLNYSSQQFEQLIAIKGLPRLTPNTLTTKRELFENLERIRHNDIAFDNEECEIGARCIAAPVRDYTGSIIYAVSVCGPAARMTDQHIQDKLLYLRDTADQMSLLLGYQKAASM